MKVSEITDGILTEGIQQIWGRQKGKVVRKFRCTSGSRKGRIVAKPETCNAAKNIGSMITMKKARRLRNPVLQVKSSRRKRTGVASQRIASLNKPLSQKRYGKAVARRKALGKKSRIKPRHTRVSLKKGAPQRGLKKRRKSTRKKIK
ncbi:uncharacterized protein METZ01_LOCUS86065 [marine metagenome]|uniref:Uncharacterized protein n=1 Tax=marine metagenome TaxID=408172 RepID=A0A381UZP9_9ZZZZ